MEEFRIIQGFENYSVSNYGRIRREAKGIMAKVGVIKNAQVNKKTGYTHCKVSGSEGKRSMSLHRLVAEAFIPNPDGLREIDHIDRDKQNNHVDNLRWVTRRENMRNIVGKKALCPILAYPPDGGEPLQFECLRDAATYIAELIKEDYWPQGISNVLNNPRYTHYKGWRFERLSAAN
jgi:hypothetical protein